MTIDSIICCGVILISIALIVLLLHKIRKDVVALATYKAELASIDKDTGTDCNALLDSFLDETIQTYLVKNVNIITADAINSELETKIRKDIVNLVSERISPSLINKLSLYYNKYAISNIIVDKIYLKITEMVIEHNKIR